MRRIIVLIPALLLAAVLITAGAAENTETDGTIPGTLNISYFEENGEYFRTEVSEDGTAAYIQDGRAGLDHLFKGAGPEGNGLIVQEALLGVSQDIYVDPRLVLDLVQNDGGAGQFPDGAGAVGLICLHPIVVHDPFELQHDLL